MDNAIRAQLQELAASEQRIRDLLGGLAGRGRDTLAQVSVMVAESQRTQAALARLADQERRLIARLAACRPAPRPPSP